MTAYRIDLENFEGPFDLLLYLIKKEEMNIYDIPIARITEQYMTYIDTIKILDLNNAGEFLVMAATLMHIKSKMLLPLEKVSIDEEFGTDPRDELVARLLEYKKYKEIASKLKNKEIEQSNLYQCKISQNKNENNEETLFEATLFDLVTAFNQIYKAGTQEKVYEINRIIYRVEEKIDFLLEILIQNNDINLKKLFENCKHKLEIVVTFLALLELIKRKEVIAWQSKLFAEIWISKNKAAEENTAQITAN
ncbi:segregation/condensation protein A [Candidatus Desantisbacteria bacterium]|nr:segregation/condensation protein A [Candidatus Desantisbacteria bacterium]